MHNVSPQVYLIGKTSVVAEVFDWLKDIGVSQDAIGERYTLENKTDAELLVELAGRRCYKSFEVGINPNVTRIREDITAYLDNLLASGHGSVLEHVVFNFALENVSRVFTAEMNRHRAGMAISEGSMRYIRLEDIPFWIPRSIQAREDELADSGPYEVSTLVSAMLTMLERAADLAQIPDAEKPELFGMFSVMMNKIVSRGATSCLATSQQKAISRAVMKNAFYAAETFYRMLANTWKDELSPESTFALKKEITSMMRRIIPIGVATGGVWSGNIRALRHIFTMRCDKGAEEEIFCVAVQMLNCLRDAEPNFFGDFRIADDGSMKPKYRKV